MPERTGLRESVAAGGYVIWQHDNGLELALIATGSEVSIALDVAHTLADEGVAVRVISMPCTEWFDEQHADYREQILPESITARVAVEAGVCSGWWKYVGLSGRVVGIETFGVSGSGSEVVTGLGITRATVLGGPRRTHRPLRVYPSTRCARKPGNRRLRDGGILQRARPAIPPTGWPRWLRLRDVQDTGAHSIGEPLGRPL